MKWHGRPARGCADQMLLSHKQTNPHLFPVGCWCSNLIVFQMFPW